MIKSLKQYLFPTLIALSALSVSASAAFYSVSGLSKLFAGAAFAVIIMAASLEVAKLVIASLLYQYRTSLPKLLKIYLSIACVVLIGITSMGIYGFLSSAYQETASKSGTIDAQIALVETKRDNVKSQLNVYNAEKESINKAVADLRTGLANNVITYTDANGNMVTTTSSATRRALEKQLDQAIERQTNLNSKVDELNTQLFEYETEIVEVSTNNELAGELGPLKYLSGLTGYPMDKIINVLLLIIIFVFDPLAIALVIAANFAFAQLRPKKEYPLEEQVEDMRKVVNAYDTLQDEVEDNEGSDIYTEDELSDWDSTLQDGLEDENFDVWGAENDNKTKLNELESKYNSLVEYLSNLIEIEDQQINQKQEDMKLFNFFKKKEIQEPLAILPEEEMDETLQWDEYGNPEPIIEDDIKPIEEPSQPIEISKIDVNNDGQITMDDLIKVRQILSDPSLPEYKKSYWEAIEERLVKSLESKPDPDNTITYN